MPNRSDNILVAVHAGDPGAVGRAFGSIAAALPQVRLRWRQRGFRGHGEVKIVRNSLGHLDGVIVPRGPREMAESVWIAQGAAAGGTICVIRRLRPDQPRFTALSKDDKERTIGRRRSDGSPPSGGGPRAEVDLSAKTPDGQYKVPAHSRARAAHPSFTDSTLA